MTRLAIVVILAFVQATGLSENPRHDTLQSVFSDAEQSKALLIAASKELSQFVEHIANIQSIEYVVNIPSSPVDPSHLNIRSTCNRVETTTVFLRLLHQCCYAIASDNVLGTRLLDQLVSLLTHSTRHTVNYESLIVPGYAEFCAASNADRALPALELGTNKLMDSMLFSIVAHELAHVHLGHCHSAPIDEYAAHTREYDADELASQWMIRMDATGMLAISALLPKLILATIANEASYFQSHPLAFDRLVRDMGYVRSHAPLIEQIGLSKLDALESEVKMYAAERRQWRSSAITGEEAENRRLQLISIVARSQRDHSDDVVEKLFAHFDDPVVQNHPLLVEIRTKQILSALVRIGRRSDAARRGLLDRRDRAASNVLSMQRNSNSQLSWITELSVINEAILAESHTLMIYDRLRWLLPNHRYLSELRWAVFDELRHHQRYPELAEGIDFVHEAHAAIIQFEMQLAAVQKFLLPEHRSAELHVGAQQVIERIGSYYEVLMGAGRIDQAVDVENILLRFEYSPRTFVTLAESAYRADAPCLESFQYAEWAMLASGDRDVRAALVLSRLHISIGQLIEARTILNRALHCAADDYDCEDIEDVLLSLERMEKKIGFSSRRHR